MGQWTRTGSRGRAGEWSAELDSFSKLDLRIASNLTISRKGAFLSPLLMYRPISFTERTHHPSFIGYVGK